MFFRTFTSVKEQVNDILSAIFGLSEQIRSLQVKNDLQYKEICRLNRNIDRQNKEIRELKKENARLRKELGKNGSEPPKDSSNSSTPPSKEKMSSEVVRRTRSLREKSGKNPLWPARPQGKYIGYVHESG